MSGDSAVSDTNTLLYLLDDSYELSGLAEKKLDGKQIWISVITELELYGKKGLQKDELQSIDELVKSCYIADLNPNIKNITKNLLQTVKLKLPDAIIASTAIYMRLPLITADSDFKKIPWLDLIFLNN